MFEISILHFRHMHHNIPYYPGKMLSNLLFLLLLHLGATTKEPQGRLSQRSVEYIIVMFLPFLQSFERLRILNPTYIIIGNSELKIQRNKRIVYSHKSTAYTDTTKACLDLHMSTFVQSGRVHGCVKCVQPNRRVKISQRPVSSATKL